MRSPNIGDDGVSASHLLSPNESSITKTGLNFVELLANGVTWKSPKQPRMLLEQWTALCKLRAGPYF